MSHGHQQKLTCVTRTVVTPTHTTNRHIIAMLSVRTMTSRLSHGVHVLGCGVVMSMVVSGAGGGCGQGPRGVPADMGEQVMTFRHVFVCWIL